MKKLINDPGTVVADALRGIEAAHSATLHIDHTNRLIIRSDAPRPGKVAVISGGGSGHEPLHGGFVGPGMLDAAVCGEVFTSPTPDQVEAALQATNGGAGALLIVKNYTGDVMNFEMAAELAAADDIETASVIVQDDVAVTDSLFTAGRRGVGGTVAVEKIAGAAAEAGLGLTEATALAQRTADACRSMGLALTSCTVPAAGRPTFDLADDEIELGIGIHGEPGRSRHKIAPVHDLAPLLLDPILGDLDFTDGPVIVICNGMGGTPLMELYGLYAEVSDLLKARGIQIARNLVGNYVTSLEMAGASVTLVKADDELLNYWDAPVATSGLRW
ncbi:dihydroxyacetone kinase subunit DhaK [Propionimicrobium sp. PCR01-08-3]|uniref:dihydroxyacetone kinase subunit DhaK n=1 Tax=Propionimicrobium sp. PCR01-08-3 TaxID=3052086 RepID=UPI00255C697A|nr:dihydroxyacetone kinase subunit DhaK [Propionimicrobium sp. PCR01-08-3]WIY81515.1 dihydroxyacetone kinase subunit DhaK [Propionimicrobium sp. PCR01-08-3]